jgi:REP element-mobilizing transposase RayT
LNEYTEIDTSHRLRNLRDYQKHYLGIVKPLHQRFLAIHGNKQLFPRFVWQSSFRDHIIRDENDFLNHLEYIYSNAIKHGMVNDPEQYPFTWISGMKSPFTPD